MSSSLEIRLAALAAREAAVSLREKRVEEREEALLRKREEEVFRREKRVEERERALLRKEGLVLESSEDEKPADDEERKKGDGVIAERIDEKEKEERTTFEHVEGIKGIPVISTKEKPITAASMEGNKPEPPENENPDVIPKPEIPIEEKKEQESILVEGENAAGIEPEKLEQVEEGHSVPADSEGPTDSTPEVHAEERKPVSVENEKLESAEGRNVAPDVSSLVESPELFGEKNTESVGDTLAQSKEGKSEPSKEKEESTASTQDPPSLAENEIETLAPILEFLKPTVYTLPGEVKSILIPTAAKTQKLVPNKEETPAYTPEKWTPFVETYPPPVTTNKPRLWQKKSVSFEELPRFFEEINPAYSDEEEEEEENENFVAVILEINEDESEAVEEVKPTPEPIEEAPASVTQEAVASELAEEVPVSAEKTCHISESIEDIYVLEIDQPEDLSVPLTDETIPLLTEELNHIPKTVEKTPKATPMEEPSLPIETHSPLHEELLATPLPVQLQPIAA